MSSSSSPRKGEREGRSDNEYGDDSGREDNEESGGCQRRQGRREGINNNDGRAVEAKKGSGVRKRR